MTPTKEEVARLYEQGESLRTIGKRYCLCAQAILNWMRKWGIPTRPQASPDKWNAREAEIRFLYENQRMSQDQIAVYFGADQGQVYRVMKRLKIRRRSRAREGVEHYAYKDGKASRKYRKLIVKDQCSKCEATNRLVVHHKNLDHYDDRIENLEILCESCHNSLSKRLWWAKKRQAKSLG